MYKINFGKPGTYDKAKYFNIARNDEPLHSMPLW
ncbi:hypothetical protein C7972_107135 [Arenibacter sp. ARW7G5Y1]|nr:hypothetical protein C7972_107135 [Arenibacter sp. ARW7G5Y1]